MRSISLLAAAAALLCACGNDKAAPATSAAVIKAWKAAGLTISSLSSAQLPALAAAECQSGTINAVDIVLCSYPDEAAATAAQPKGFALVGAATGTAIAQKTLLLVVTDRRKVDPSGRTIDRVTKIFRGRPIQAAPRTLSARK